MAIHGQVLRPLWQKLENAAKNAATTNYMVSEAVASLENLPQSEIDRAFADSDLSILLVKDS